MTQLVFLTARASVYSSITNSCLSPRFFFGRVYPSSYRSITDFVLHLGSRTELGLLYLPGRNLSVFIFSGRFLCSPVLDCGIIQSSQVSPAVRIQSSTLLNRIMWSSLCCLFGGSENSAPFCWQYWYVATTVWWQIFAILSIMYEIWKFLSIFDWPKRTLPGLPLVTESSIHACYLLTVFDLPLQAFLLLSLLIIGRL